MKPVPQASERFAHINQIMYREPAAALALANALRSESLLLGDVATQVEASVIISTTEDQLGERFDGGKLLLEALALCETHDLREQGVQVLERLGRDRYTAGLYAESLAYWTRCIEECRALQHCGHTHVYALIGLGHICSAYNESELAIQFHRAALQLLKLHPDPLMYAKAQISLGWDLYNMGNLAEAKQILQDTVVHSRVYQFGHYVSESLLHLGTIELKAHQTNNAEQYLEDALEELQQTPSHWVEANVLGKLAEVRFLQGEPQMARDMVERAIRFAMQDGMRHIEARLNAQAAGYCAALSDVDGMKFYGQQLDRLHETNTVSWHIPAINLSNIRQYLPKK